MNEYDIKLRNVLGSHDENLIESYKACIDVYLEDPIVKRKIKLIDKIKQAIEDRIKLIPDEMNYSIMELYHVIEIERCKNTSKSICPGHSIVLYPSILEKIAHKDIKCDFSKELIKKNSTYYNYGFLMEDLTARNKYVLERRLNVATQYFDLLPQSIRELEEFNENLTNAYINDDETFYNIASNLKSEKLKIKKTR